MSLIIEAVIAISALFGAPLSVGAVMAITTAIVTVMPTVALMGLSHLLNRGPKTGLTQNPVTVTTRQALGPRRVIYGSVRVGGNLTFIGVSTDGIYIYLVITLAGHELTSIDTMYFDNVAVPLDGSGDATGTYAGYVHVEKNLGTATQSAFAGLVAANVGWTANHKQSGCAGVYVRLKFNPSLFNGTPNITFDVTGKKVYDPRTQLTLSAAADHGAGTTVYTGTITGGAGNALAGRSYTVSGFPTAANNGGPWLCSASSATTLTLANAAGVAETHAGLATCTTLFFSANVALCVADDLCDSKYSLGVPYATRIDEALLIAAANLCDESVTLLGRISSVKVAFGGLNYAVGDQITLPAYGNADALFTVLSVSATGAGISLALTTPGTGYTAGSALVTGTSGSGSGLTVDITSAGSTEARYTADGAFDCTVAPGEIIKSLAAAMAGTIVYAGGLWRIYGGSYRAPSMTITEAQLAGPIQYQPRVSARDVSNGIKGTYVSPVHDWQPSNFPAVQSATYLAEDDDVSTWADISLPFTTSPSRAQRLATIALNDSRRQGLIDLSCKISCYNAWPMDTLQVTNTRFSWSAKTFQILSCGLALDDTGALVYNIHAKETDVDIWGWTTAQDNPPTAQTLPIGLPAPRSVFLLSEHTLDDVPDGVTHVRPMYDETNHRWLIYDMDLPEWVVVSIPGLNLVDHMVLDQSVLINPNEAGTPIDFWTRDARWRALGMGTYIKAYAFDNEDAGGNIELQLYSPDTSASLSIMHVPVGVSPAADDLCSFFAIIDRNPSGAAGKYQLEIGLVSVNASDVIQHGAWFTIDNDFVFSPYNARYFACTKGGGSQTSTQFTWSDDLGFGQLLIVRTATSFKFYGRPDPATPWELGATVTTNLPTAALAPYCRLTALTDITGMKSTKFYHMQAVSVLEQGT